MPINIEDPEGTEASGLRNTGEVKNCILNFKWYIF